MRLFCVAVLTISLATPTFADNWPSWRGPNNAGISAEKSIPAVWSLEKNLVWKLDLPGIGSSTPAIWGDKIFLTAEAPTGIVLMCVGTDGKLIWEKPLGTSSGKARGDEGNGASGSPTTDGKHVWAVSGKGELACFDFDGKQIWKTELEKVYGKFHYQFGMHMTPVLEGDSLYLMLIHSKPGLVISLDKTTGKEKWKIVRPSDGRDECEHSYASPVVWHGKDKSLLIVHGNDYTTGHELADGKEVWRVGGLNPKTGYNPTLRFVASPLAVEDLIVIPTAKNGPVVAIHPDGTGLIEAGNSVEVWRKLKGTPDVPSPLVKDGLVYLCGETGRLTCLDAKTGQEYYAQDGVRTRHRASPLYVDGKIILASRDGRFSVIAAGKKFELLATNKLPDDFTASPAAAGGRLYLRGFKALYAIGEK